MVIATNQDYAHLFEFKSYEHGSVHPPIIGFAMDYIDTRKDVGSYWFSEYPWYATSKRYHDAVISAGGIPVCFCYSMSSVDKFLELVDGLFITGSGFDVEPVLYGESFKHKATTTSLIKTQFDTALLTKALKVSMPILGVNTGMQLINVILGGTLIQHITDYVPGAITHLQDTLFTSPHHDVEIYEETKLFNFVKNYDNEYFRSMQTNNGSLLIKTNSLHHQAVNVVAPSLTVNAMSKDGVIEGIESKSNNFCLGVQWNAEFVINQMDCAIFKSFIEAARTNKN